MERFCASICQHLIFTTMDTLASMVTVREDKGQDDERMTHIEKLSKISAL